MNYEDLRNSISNTIKTNGAQRITGAVLQEVLLNMVSSLGQFATYAGVATPGTNPAGIDGNAFYVATSVGNYQHFGFTIEGKGVYVISNLSGAWSPVRIPIVADQAISDGNGDNIAGTYARIDSIEDVVRYWDPDTKTIGDIDNLSIIINAEKLRYKDGEDEHGDPIVQDVKTAIDSKMPLIVLNNIKDNNSDRLIKDVVTANIIDSEVIYTDKINGGVPYTTENVYSRYHTFNGNDYEFLTSDSQNNGYNFFAPTTAGTSGQVLVSTGATPSWRNVAEVVVSNIYNLQVTGGQGDYVYVLKNGNELNIVSNEEGVSVGVDIAHTASYDNEGNYIATTYQHVIDEDNKLSYAYISDTPDLDDVVRYWNVDTKTIGDPDSPSIIINAESLSYVDGEDSNGDPVWRNVKTAIDETRAAIPTNNNQLINGEGYINSAYVSQYLADNNYAKVSDITADAVGLGNVQNTAFYTRSVDVNGEDWAFASPYEGQAFSIYAPTSAGTIGQVLKSNGSGAPEWMNQSDIIAGKSNALYSNGLTIQANTTDEGNARLVCDDDEKRVEVDYAHVAYMDSAGNVISSTYQPLATAINTGNIGSQRVSYATNAGQLGGVVAANTFQYRGFLGSGGVDEAMTNANSGSYTIANYYTNAPLSNIYGTLIQFQGSESWISQLALYGASNREPAIYYRRSQSSPDNATSWKQIAFTDSNVASATKATQDSNGNVIASYYLPIAALDNIKDNNSDILIKDVMTANIINSEIVYADDVVLSLENNDSTKTPTNIKVLFTNYNQRIIDIEDTISGYGNAVSKNFTTSVASGNASLVTSDAVYSAISGLAKKSQMLSIGVFSATSIVNGVLRCEYVAYYGVGGSWSGNVDLYDGDIIIIVNSNNVNGTFTSWMDIDHSFEAECGTSCTIYSGSGITLAALSTKLYPANYL